MMMERNKWVIESEMKPKEKVCKKRRTIYGSIFLKKLGKIFILYLLWVQQEILCVFDAVISQDSYPILKSIGSSLGLKKPWWVLQSFISKTKIFLKKIGNPSIAILSWFIRVFRNTAKILNYSLNEGTSPPLRTIWISWTIIEGYFQLTGRNILIWSKGIRMV